jgi:hypothetical protein
MMTSRQLFSEKFIGIALLSLAGPFIWVLHFAVVYGVQHFFCAILESRADFWVDASIITITLIALSVLVLLIAKPDILQGLDRHQAIQESSQIFFSGVMRLMALLSFFGVLWSGIALFFLPACGSVA